MERLSYIGEPFPLGLSFVPPETLTPLADDISDPAEALAVAAGALRASFAFVSAEVPWAEDAVRSLLSAGIAPLWAISGPLWPLLQTRGIVEGLRATLTRPDEIGRQLDEALNALLADIGHALRLGARGLVLAEDLAGSAGPLVAPDFAIAELVPRYERIVRSARSLGMPVIFHSDGDIRPLMPALAKAGFAAVHVGGGLQMETFERVFWSARDLGLAVVGGLLTAELGNDASAEAVGSMVGVLAQAGGLFVADDGGITESRQVASLVTAVAAARAV